MTSVRAPVRMLWIGPRLSTLEQLSIRSFLAHGHPVHLYTYADVEGVPEGTQQRDGREVLPADSVFTYADGFGKGSHAAFANMFRYKLLLDEGGIWCDTDVVCLKPFDFDAEHVIGRERTPPLEGGPGAQRIATAVMKMPRGSAAMRECYDVCARVDKSKLRWGETGPLLVTHSFLRHGLDEHALPPDAFYPVDWWNTPDLVTKPLSVGPATYAIHLWNQIWKANGLDKDAVYPAGCAYDELKRRYRA
jgi:hypothetical protein